MDRLDVGGRRLSGGDPGVGFRCRVALRRGDAPDDRVCGPDGRGAVGGLSDVGVRGAGVAGGVGGGSVGSGAEAAGVPDRGVPAAGSARPACLG